MKFVVFTIIRLKHFYKSNAKTKISNSKKLLLKYTINPILKPAKQLNKYQY